MINSTRDGFSDSDVVPKKLEPLHELQFETAAEHHTRSVPTALPEQRVGDVRSALAGRRYDSASEIVVCDAVGRFLGLVNIEDLLAADDEQLLSTIMDPNTPVITPGVDQEIASWQAIRHRETCLAVVDHDGRFQGIITPRRIFEVLLWEHDEDTARLGGVLHGRSEACTASEEPLLRRLGHRLPWLLLGVLGALLSADLVGAFEWTIQRNVILAFFVPAIVYLADAVGTQTETLVIRGMSLGIPVERVFLREWVTGVLIGIVLAGVSFPLVLFRWGRIDVAIAVTVALLAACSIASVVAMLLPWLLRRIRQDPAYAAGPLATVAQDLLSVLIYFLVCRAIV